MNTIKMKRVYDPKGEDDGFRILVDRAWPRGLKKEKAQIDQWIKYMTPTTDLCKVFNHEPEKMDWFKTAYMAELSTNRQSNEFISSILDNLKSGNVTLIYAAKDTSNNHATILMEWIKQQISSKYN